MQDVANEILLKHLNQQENPDEVTISFHNNPKDEHEKFDLTKPGVITSA